jgi:hypothetical protein
MLPRPLIPTFAIVLAALGAIGCQRRDAATRVQRVDLLASVDRAEKRPQGAAVTTTLATLDGDTEPALDVPAISRIIWTARMPDHAVLRTALGAPQLAPAGDARALFRIGISDERTYDGLFAAEIGLGSAQGWKPVSIDLSKYSGFKWSLFYHPRQKTWKVIFNTTISGLGRPVVRTDRLFWAHPSIEDATSGVDSTPGRM